MGSKEVELLMSGSYLSTFVTLQLVISGIPAVCCNQDYKAILPGGEANFMPGILRDAFKVKYFLVSIFLNVKISHLADHGLHLSEFHEILRIFNESSRFAGTYNLSGFF